MYRDFCYSMTPACLQEPVEKICKFQNDVWSKKITTSDFWSQKMIPIDKQRKRWKKNTPDIILTYTK